MGKARALRLAGFIGALGVSAALVGASITGTGAYFTDSKAGNIHGTSGHLTLTTTPAAPLNLSYDGLMPGQNVDRTIDYRANVSAGGVDLWLSFDPGSTGYAAFTGPSNSTIVTGGGLGRYGYFAVSDTNGGQAFVTGNLSFLDTGGNTCPTDSNGRGGSATIALVKPQPVDKCGVPDKILLASNLVDGQTGTVTITFGLNGAYWTSPNSPAVDVDFQLVATQHGQRP